MKSKENLFHQKIENLKSDIEFLKNENADLKNNLLLHLFNLIEIPIHTSEPINVIDENDNREPVKFLSNEIICIITDDEKKKSRKDKTKSASIRDKLIYSANEITGIKKFRLNNNKLNFDKLIEEIDPQQRFLVKVSKNTIVNVLDFELIKFDSLQCRFPEKELKLPKISLSKKYHNKFVKLQTIHGQNFLLQKRGIDYIKNLGL